MRSASTVHRSLLWASTALLWVLTISGCSDSGHTQGCLAGARVCEGPIVLVCSPLTGGFVEEMKCPAGTSCHGGACLSARFQEGEFPTTDGDSDGGILDAGPEDNHEPADAANPHADAKPVDSRVVKDTEAADSTSIPTPDQDSTTSADSEVNPEDSGPKDGTGDGDLPSDNSTPGFLLYEQVSQFALKDDINRLAWAPSGKYAILIGTKGAVGHYSAETGMVTLLLSCGEQLADVVPWVGEDVFLIIGQVDDQGALWRLERVEDKWTTSKIGALTGLAVAMARDPDSARVAIASRGGQLINFLTLYDTPDGLSSAKGYNNPHVTGLMWGDPSLYGGIANVITADGFNGAGSKTWLLDTNDMISNNWSAGFGNPGRGQWRPNGSYGMFAGVSSNKVYVFFGTWTKATLPVGSAASPHTVAWRQDGKRALVVGRAIGSPLAATVVEHRPLANINYSANFIDQSIPNFDAAPYFGHGNMHLLDVAWRPNTLCDEGLIVGTDNGSSFNPTFGTVIRFYDSNDSACTSNP